MSKSIATYPKLRLGVSACLLGQSVRFDGGHKRDRWVTDVLGAYAEWVPVCPEMEIGLPSPRPTLRLVARSDGTTRLFMPKTGQDLSTEMGFQFLGDAKCDVTAPGIAEEHVRTRSIDARYQVGVVLDTCV